jgi:hypothetical protein
VWNYIYFKTSFAVDGQLLSWHHFSLCIQQSTSSWRLEYPVSYRHTGQQPGFLWHIKCTSKQIYTISRLITELCPSFLPQEIEKQFFSDLPLLLQWREFDFIYQELRKRGFITEVLNTIVPENHSKSQHSFAVAILCKAQLALRFIGVPKIDQFWQEFLDNYCYCRDISPRIRAEGTWTTTENLIMDLPINPTFAAEADIEFVEPMAD